MKIELYGSEGEFQKGIEMYREDSRFNGFDYRVVSGDANREGIVEVRIKNLYWFYEMDDIVGETLSRIIGSEDEDIAWIWKFYPHGDKNISGLTMKGVGTKVLRGVLENIEFEGVDYFYSFNPEDKFRKLLSREGFEDIPIEEDPNEYLLRIA